MKKSLLGFLAVVFLALGSADLSAQDQDPVILTVAGEQISRSEFLNVYLKNNVNSEVLDRKSLEEYMELYINFRLKVKEAEALGMDTMRAFRDELSGYRKQLAQPYLIDEDMNKALLQEAFDRKQTDIRASHILIRVDRNAAPADTLAAFKKVMAIRKRLQKGEDFGKLAMELSDDLSARDRTMEGRTIKGNKGDLGYFTVFDMVYPFETGAYNTPAGEISMPVRSDFGYHLIKITDRKPALGRVQVAHIMLRIPAGASVEDSNRVAQNATDIYNRIKSGEDFSRMADQYSDDKSTASKGGMLPWFGANKMIPEFIAEITKIKKIGDLAEPFLTSFGWHIVKLIDRKEIGTYDENLNELKQSLTRSDRAKRSEEALISHIKNEYKFTEKSKTLAPFYKAVTDTIFEAKWKKEKAAGLEKTMFTIGRRGYTQQDFAAYLEKNQRKRNKEDIRTFVNQMYGSFVNESLLTFEDSQLEQKYPEFRMLVKEYRDGILLFELTDRKIWSKAVADSAGLELFYENNRNNYMWEERADATIYTIHSTDAVIVAAVKASIAKGISGNELLDLYNSDTLLMLTFDRKKYENGDNELVDSVNWKPGIYDQTAEEGKTKIIQIHELVKPEPKKLNEARGLITADYQNFLEKEWIKELRDKYSFSVDQEVLSTIK